MREYIKFIAKKVLFSKNVSWRPTVLKTPAFGHNSCRRLRDEGSGETCKKMGDENLYEKGTNKGDREINPGRVTISFPNYF